MYTFAQELDGWGIWRFLYWEGGWRRIASGIYLCLWFFFSIRWLRLLGLDPGIMLQGVHLER